LVTDNLGCQILSDPFTLITYPSTAEDPDTISGIFCALDVVTLFANGSGTILWYDSPTSTTVINTGFSFTTPILTPTTPYYVTNSNDSCTSNRIPVYAIAVPCDSIIVPNIFTPNGDGTNDEISFNPVGATCLDVIIYDRWGVEVFSTQTLNTKWNGTNKNGEPLSDGVYFYLIQYCPKFHDAILKRGFIQLFN